MLHKSLSVQLIILANQTDKENTLGQLEVTEKKTMKKPVGSG